MRDNDSTDAVKSWVACGLFKHPPIMPPPAHRLPPNSNVGALKVMVNKGLGLTKMDMFSESDPFVVAYTNPKCVCLNMMCAGCRCFHIIWMQDVDHWVQDVV